MSPCNKSLRWRANLLFTRVREKYKYFLSLSLKDQFQSKSPLRSHNSILSFFDQTEFRNRSLTRQVPFSIMHGLMKLLPLALSALAVALPAELQDRASTTYTDTVGPHPSTQSLESS